MLGQIPSSIGNITQLVGFNLRQNNLEGSIPPSIGNCLSLQQYKTKPSSIVSKTDLLPIISYKVLHRATNGFSLNNLIGSGSFGSVYKGVLNQEEMLVAVKVLN